MGKSDRDGRRCNSRKAIKRSQLRFHFKQSVERAKLMQEKNQIENKKKDETSLNE